MCVCGVWCVCVCVVCVCVCTWVCVCVCDPIQLKLTAMIGALVRLPDNFLHLGESERVLRQESHFEELIDLYKSKGRHSKGRRSE